METARGAGTGSGGGGQCSCCDPPLPPTDRRKGPLLIIYYVHAIGDFQMWGSALRIAITITGHEAALNTENQRLLFTRAHEDDHTAYGIHADPSLPSPQVQPSAARSRFGYDQSCRELDCVMSSWSTHFINWPCVTPAVSTHRAYDRPYALCVYFTTDVAHRDGTGQDRTGQDRTGQDRTEQDRTGQDRTERGAREQQKRKSRSPVSKTVPKSSFQRKQEKLRKAWAAKRAKGGASNFLQQWSALGGA
eukprot:COSAG06_NODE_1387_length_9616_cov_4.512136_5_plen_248_part_00